MNASKIKQLRALLGDTCDQFGARIGISDTSIRKWENGGVKISEANVAKLEELLRQHEAGQLKAGAVSTPPKPRKKAKASAKRTPRVVRLVAPKLGGMEALLDAAQTFHEARRAQLVNDAVAFAVKDSDVSSTEFRKALVLFLHLVQDEAPAAVREALIKK